MSPGEMLSAFLVADAAFFQARAATYTAPAEDAEPVPVRVVYDDVALETIGAKGPTVAMRREVGLLLEDVAQPQRGALLRIDAQDYRLSALVSAGHGISVWTVTHARA